MARSRALALSLSLALVSTSSGASPPVLAETALVDQLYQDILAGTTRGAFLHLTRLYDLAGAPASDLLPLVLQSPYEPLSRYGSDGTLTMSRFLRPGEGMAYWRSWSQILTDGAWDPATAFSGEEHARQVGNVALLGLLAHELGPHVVDVHSINEEDWPLRELLADELAARVLRTCRRHPGLEPLVTAYRQIVVGQLRRAVGDETRQDIWPVGDPPPSPEQLREACGRLGAPRSQLGTAAYVSLQLQRQQALLDAPVLSSLEEFLTERRSHLPARLAAEGSVEVGTVQEVDVPDWIRHSGSPAALWNVSASAIQEKLASVLPPSQAAPPDPVAWRMRGPRSALTLVALPAAQGGQATLRVIELTHEPGAALSVRELASRAGELPQQPDLLVRPNGLAISGMDFKDGGLVLRWWRAEDGGLLEPGDFDGLRLTSGPSADGTLESWPLSFHARRHLVAESGVLIFGTDRIFVAGHGARRTLAGGLRGLRDGRVPTEVRMAFPQPLAWDGERAWFTSEGPDGPVFRWLRWEPTVAP